MAVRKRRKSTVNKAGNYTKPAMRQRLFNKIKAGRYLPESVRKTLTPAQKAYENRKKRAASKKGKQRAKYSKKTRRKVGRL